MNISTILSSLVIVIFSINIIVQQGANNKMGWACALIWCIIATFLKE